MSLQNRLKECRIKKGLSQSETAKKLGIAKRTYQAYERGEREISTLRLAQICQCFNVSSDYLLGVDNEKSPPLTKSEELRGEIARMTEDLSVKELKELIKFLDYLIWLEEQS